MTSDDGRGIEHRRREGPVNGCRLGGGHRPQFLIIGAQKAGTTWLWQMLDEHPGTDLPRRKEIFFFSRSEVYQKGLSWYLRHFAHLDPRRVTGEASTDYLYDRVLWGNRRVDKTLPSVADLVVGVLPDVRIVVALRDPVQRAVSAYYHHLRRRRFPPGTGLVRADRTCPHLRIVDRGHYARFLESWQERVPPTRLRCYVFEEDIVHHPAQTVADLYRFVGLDDRFMPRSPATPRNARWTRTHLFVNYYSLGLYGLVRRGVHGTRLAGMLDRMDLLPEKSSLHGDVRWLRHLYLPNHERLERMLGRSLTCWTYGMS